MNIIEGFFLYLAKKFHTEERPKEVDILRKQLVDANRLYYSTAEENTKLRNKLSSLSFKDTWYEERIGYLMPLDRRLIVLSKDGKYFVGRAMKDSQDRTEFHIDYELTPVNPKLKGSVVLEFRGRETWVNRWKILELPEDQKPEPKKCDDDCKMAAR